MTFLDVGDEGQSVGDRRITSGELRNEDNELAGWSTIETTLLRIEVDGTVRQRTEISLMMPEGTLHYIVAPSGQIRDISDVSGPVNTPDAARIITGGSGVFAGAYGNVDMSQEDGYTAIRLNVACHDTVQ